MSTSAAHRSVQCKSVGLGIVVNRYFEDSRIYKND